MTVRSALSLTPLPPASPPGVREHQKYRLGRTGWALVCLALTLGAILRALWIFPAHPYHSRQDFEQRYVYSDMRTYWNQALAHGNPHHRWDIGDTIYPPGGGYYYAWLLGREVDIRRMQIGQFLVSWATVLLLGAVAYVLFGELVFAISISLASLSTTLIDYSAYVLTETPYTLAVLLTIVLLLQSLRARSPTSLLAWSLLAGLAFGISMSLKTALLLFVPLYVVFVLLLTWRGKLSHAGVRLGAFAVGAALLLAPLSQRATRLNEGRFLIVANEGLRLVMGNQGEVRTIRFRDPKRSTTYYFTPPAHIQKGFSKELELPIGAYDTGKLLAVAWGWMRSHPLAALGLGVERIFDLFIGTTPWPTHETKYRILAALGHHLFTAFVTVPALLYLLRRTRAMTRLENGALVELLLLLPLLAIVVAVFLSQSEPRYRAPFDPLLILFASLTYAHWWQRQPRHASM